MPVQTKEPLSASGIEFAPGFVREVGESARALRIPVDDVRSCELRFGSLSKRPRLQLAVGGVMFSAIVLVVEAFANFYEPSKGGGRVAVAALFVALIGAWLIYDALRKVYYLKVTTTFEDHHLRLLPQVDEVAIRALRRAASEGSGLEIALPATCDAAQR